MLLGRAAHLDGEYTVFGKAREMTRDDPRGD